MTKDNVLLLGNGLNRISKDYSWETLITHLIKKFCNGDVSYHKNFPKPFPLLYEEILSYALLHGTGNEAEIKEFIKEEIDNIQLNQSHSLLKNTKFVDILTTNYDETIEKVIGGGAQFINKAPVEEQKYSLFRRKIAFEVSQSIWHIHGEALKPNTITLGYEQYSGYLQNIRESIVSGKKYTNFDLPKLSARLDSTASIHTWTDYFFSHEVHIVGLTLDFSEIDLWWLLVYRSRQKNNRLNMKKNYQIENKIYYYHPTQPSGNSVEKNRLEILESLDVTLVPVKLHENKYYEFYEEVFEREMRL